MVINKKQELSFIQDTHLSGYTHHQYCCTSFNLSNTANYSSEFSKLEDTKYKSDIQTKPPGFYFQLYPRQHKHTTAHTAQGHSTEGDSYTSPCTASKSFQNNLSHSCKVPDLFSHQGIACLPPPILRTTHMQNTEILR